MWSKTKKQLESLICEALKNRVEYFCSNYRMHDGIGRAYITIDKQEVLNMCTLKRDYYQKPVEGQISQVEFLNAAFEFLNNSIEVSLKSENPIIRMLAVLDRRVGKRTLEEMKQIIENEHEIVVYFFKLRCEAENIQQKTF